MRIVIHAGIVAGALFLLLGLPVIHSGYLQKMAGADVISSASVIIDQPSGAYVVLINKEMHKDAEKLSVWETFFRGGEIDFIFEDINCAVADSDPSGLLLAQSFQSRLPENQMEISVEDMTLILSKASCGRYDVILISKEIYDAWNADAVFREIGADMIRSEGI